MTMGRSARLDLRPGARVRWQPAHSEEWRQGKLVRASPTGEEWLVKTDVGDGYWIDVMRLSAA